MRALSFYKGNCYSRPPPTPLPFQIPHVQSYRDHKALKKMLVFGLVLLIFPRGSKYPMFQDSGSKSHTLTSFPHQAPPLAGDPCLDPGRAKGVYKHGFEGPKYSHMEYLGFLHLGIAVMVLGTYFIFGYLDPWGWV